MTPPPPPPPPPQQFALLMIVKQKFLKVWLSLILYFSPMTLNLKEKSENNTSFNQELFK